ncbi:hypothetical protein [Burkholderia ubonensis]|uniref:hypothetical protein n=1 Tax=Burkholderia ubonensis TaxID=101571 RepID=UPI0015A66AFE|nr:hypothetical protein [Burkholderia ubonensis]
MANTSLFVEPADSMAAIFVLASFLFMVFVLFFDVRGDVNIASGAMARNGFAPGGHIPAGHA